MSVSSSHVPFKISEGINNCVLKFLVSFSYGLSARKHVYFSLLHIEALGKFFITQRRFIMPNQILQGGTTL